MRAYFAECALARLCALRAAPAFTPWRNTRARLLPPESAPLRAICRYAAMPACCRADMLCLCVYTYNVFRAVAAATISLRPYA